MSEFDRGRIAILISGRGSNMQSFIDGCTNGEMDADIALVLSNNPEAPGLKKAEQAGIATACIDHRTFDSREAFDAALVTKVKDSQADLVILAGFMRILTPVFIQPFAGRLLNIHPSLLPKYTGLHTHQRALDAGDAVAGVTVHFVTEELDGGPPVIQARVPVLEGDDADSLAARVIREEHVIYPIAAKWFLQGRLKLQDNGACLDGVQISATGIPYEADAA
ncbi:MAG: phosphoribosylglycinamide formyltransferase [Halioglobus sp.]